MQKILKTSLLVAAACFFTGSAANAESGTTRIIHTEPYGAVVTQESGVLVFRALPPTSKVIINPGGKTPLELKHTEVRETNVTIITQDDYSRNLGAKIIRLK